MEVREILEEKTVCKKNIVCVERYTTEDIYGMVCNIAASSPIPFRGFSQMLELLFQLSKEKTDIENFGYDSKELNKSYFHYPYNLKKGQAATFLIDFDITDTKVCYGKITWLEQKKDSTYRSVLELLRIMDQALLK